MNVNGYEICEGADLRGADLCDCFITWEEKSRDLILGFAGKECIYRIEIVPGKSVDAISGGDGSPYRNWSKYIPPTYDLIGYKDLHTFRGWCRLDTEKNSDYDKEHKKLKEFAENHFSQHMGIRLQYFDILLKYKEYLNGLDHQNKEKCRDSDWHEKND